MTNSPSCLVVLLAKAITKIERSLRGKSGQRGAITPLIRWIDYGANRVAPLAANIVAPLSANELAPYWCQSTTLYHAAQKLITKDQHALGSDRQRSTGQFYTQASHRGRSAYLRTIEVAKQFFGMPDSYAEHLSIPALPIEPAYMGLLPQKPKWLPEWEEDSSLDRDNLINYVEDALADFEREDNTLDLLAISLPIKLDDERWVDLTVVKVIISSRIPPQLL